MAILIAVIVLALQSGSASDLPLFGRAAFGFAVAVVSLSLALAWTVAKKARYEWRQLAKEWAASQEFIEAVNTARAPLTRELVMQTDGKIAAAIETHDRDGESHRRLEARIAALEVELAKIGRRRPK